MGNSVAHALACRAQHCTCPNDRMESVPPNIEHLLSSDISVEWKFSESFPQKKKKKLHPPVVIQYDQKKRHKIILNQLFMIYQNEIWLYEK